MQTIKMITLVQDEQAPEHEKSKVELFDATHITYRWFKMSKAEYEKRIREEKELVAMTEWADEFYKRRAEAGMTDEVCFCYLHFYDTNLDRMATYLILNTAVFIMNSAGQTVDKIYS